MNREVLERESCVTDIKVSVLYAGVCRKSQRFSFKLCMAQQFLLLFLYITSLVKNMVSLVWSMFEMINKVYRL